MQETMRALEMYRAFAEGPLAMPVVAGEKPENERFPGAVATYSIEAMMQDGKALQAGTSHYLGTGFAEASGIKYQDKDGSQQFAHTTSWGVSTRMIGGVIMTHGDDDGLRCPPQIAPHQIVIIPMLRDNDEDEAVLEYCRSLRLELLALSAFGEPLRVLLDTKAAKASNKRWSWVKKGAPIIVEVGPRDVGEGKAAILRRDRLYKDDGKLATAFTPRGEFVAAATGLLEDIQSTLYAEAKERLDANIRRDVTDLASHFAGDEAKFAGWVEVQWARPTGAALDKIVEQLKALKLTMRNSPIDAAAVDGACFFTGEPAVERILIGRTY
jgi:prolyl-tRNA synthetase